MPTAVSTARQCLAGDAVCALDEAVTVARRRSHPQTTSLHAVYALLSLPSSSLREACSLARSASYPRFQFRTLDLCFSVSLDRLPSSQTVVDEPPISNSLMAAIKRSQANQRRNSDAFYQQQQSPLSCVKVEIQQLILSILDDPVVSRVFADAGFRSCDIKLALIRPPPLPLARFSRARCPPLFLCNFPTDDLDRTRLGFSFPFSFEGDTFRKIGEILAKKTGRNPLLVGVSANDELKNFVENVERLKGLTFFPLHISGLKLFSIDKEILEGSKLNLVRRFEELRTLLEISNPGFIINFGDLIELLVDDPSSISDYVVSELTKLLEFNRERLWIMGSSANYETYMKFMRNNPSLEKLWDLQLLPINSSKSAAAGFCSRPQSSLEPHIPSGGIFQTKYDASHSLSSLSCQSPRFCHLCEEKYKQEVAAALKVSTVSIEDDNQAILPSWIGTNDGSDGAKTKDGFVLSAKVTLQRKWNDICQLIHGNNEITVPYTYPTRDQTLQRIMPCTMEKKVMDNSHHESDPSTSQNPCGHSTVYSIEDTNPCKNNLNASPKDKKVVETGLIFKQTVGQFQSLPSSSYTRPDYTKPTFDLSLSCTHSITTDLSLGTGNIPEGNKADSSENLASGSKMGDRNRRNHMVSVKLSFSEDPVPKSTFHMATDKICFDTDTVMHQSDSTNFKQILRSLLEKVGRQTEAIHDIGQTISQCRAGNGKQRGTGPKRDIWFSFVGPDMVGKKKVAIALAELLFKSGENLIYEDLSSQDSIFCSNSILDKSQTYGHDDTRFRGKTIVDRIAEKIRMKPRSVIFLEHVDKADVPVQNSLLQAIRTGRFPDSHGREVGIKDAIFVATAKMAKGNSTCSDKSSVRFSEEQVLATQCWNMKILVEHRLSNLITSSYESGKTGSLSNKRKLTVVDDHQGKHNSMKSRKQLQRASNTYLDLNLSIEEMETDDMNYSNDDIDRSSEESESWMEDFSDSVDQTIIFKPFDFDSLADNILKHIMEIFHRSISSDCCLEIDSKVILQLLKAGWFWDNMGEVKKWVELVLARSFMEIKESCTLSSHSTVKILTCEQRFKEEQDPGYCLPSRIVLSL